MLVNTVRHSSRFQSVRSIHWIGLTLLVLALIAALPLWTGPGLVNTRGGGDSPFLFFRLQQLVANLRDGVFPARWMPDAAYGLGYPFFSYYAALPYYVGALFNLIGFDLLVSIKLVQTLGFVLAAAAMYRWAARQVPTRSAAWLIAVAYTFAPFHLVNVYVRGDSLSEFYAFVFYPLILLAIDRVLETPRAFGGLALSYGGLIMTHNVSALIFSPFILLYAAATLFKSKIKNQKSKIAGWRSASAWRWPCRRGSGCPRSAKRIWCSSISKRRAILITPNIFDRASSFKARSDLITRSRPTLKRVRRLRWVWHRRSARGWASSR